MPIRKPLACVTIVASLVLGSAAAAAGADAAPKKLRWTLTCSSQHDCTFLADGNGKQSAPNSEDVYPNDIDPAKLKIVVDTGLVGTATDGRPCTYQWVYLNGRWQYLCLRD